MQYDEVYLCFSTLLKEMYPRFWLHLAGLLSSGFDCKFSGSFNVVLCMLLSVLMVGLGVSPCYRSVSRLLVYLFGSSAGLGFVFFVDGFMRTAYVLVWWWRRPVTSGCCCLWKMENKKRRLCLFCCVCVSFCFRLCVRLSVCLCVSLCVSLGVIKQYLH